MPKGIPNKRCTPEFKKIVVKTMIEENLGDKETAGQFEVRCDKRVKDWKRSELSDGVEGFAVERRGRESTGRSRAFPKEVEEDLLAEVQRI